MNIYLKALLSLLILNVSICAFGQGNNRGLGGTDKNVLSIGERLFNLEKKSEAFQLFMNMRFDYSEKVVGEELGGSFHGSLFRPEMRGTIEKWSYRIRLNMNTPFTSVKMDQLAEFVDFLVAYYKPNETWSFAFGKKNMAYGTFENDWNPMNVLQYYEFINNMPQGLGLAFDVNYHLGNQTFTFQIGNSNGIDVYEKYPQYIKVYDKSSHPLQGSICWSGHLFDDRLKTVWSYSLINQAKDCFTNQVALGTSFTAGKWTFILDYMGAFGKLDYLGIITADQKKYADKSKEAVVVAKGTSYNSLILDVSYWPTPRWDIFIKAGVTNSSANNIEQFYKYRNTIEYTGAVQFILDTMQDLRLSLAYIGKNVLFSKQSLLDNERYGRVELALLYRLKAY